MIRLRDTSDEWVPDVNTYLIFQKKHNTWATFAVLPTWAALAS
jgi:hypothetical protein